MWIPKEEAEIVQAVTAGDLEETAIFDAKTELPAKPIDLAKDVAAMATNGGVILIGVGEDSQKRLTCLTPVELKGQRERIDQIVYSNIMPPPQIEVRAIPTAADPTRGYLLIVVPMSPQAPHQIVVGNDYRYYGRRATGNTPLDEGEVARLYARRQTWNRNLDTLLTELITQAPLPPQPNLAYLHLGVWPLGSPTDLLERARQAEGAANVQSLLNTLVQQAGDNTDFPATGYFPNFRWPQRWLPHPDGWEAWLTEPGSDPEAGPTSALHFWISDNGTARLFCGRAAERTPVAYIAMDPLIADLTRRFMWVVGTLYQAAGYAGLVDLAVGIPNLHGARAMQRAGGFIHGPEYPPYNQAEYRRTTPRVAARELVNDPTGVARRLLQPLFRTLINDRYDPFGPL